MSNLVKFQDTVLDIVRTPQGQAFTAHDIGTALGYQRGSEQVAKLHREHHDELEESKHWNWYDLDSKTAIRRNGVTGNSKKGLP